jgi:hypothetical protein
MTHLATFLLSLLGFGALALATDRQQENLFGRAFDPRLARGLRVAGWAALALALGVVVKGQGWALGLVSFSGHTSLGAGLVYGALIALQPPRARGAGRPPATNRLGRPRG